MRRNLCQPIRFVMPCFFAMGWMIVNRNAERSSFLWTRLRGHQSSDAVVDYYLFGCFEEGPQTRAEMEELLRKAAERGHPDAVYWLSTLYPKGAQRDALLLKAGELGSLNAQRDLGALCATGDWTGPHDSWRAADWYRRAAERGHPDAQYNLGFMYLLGEGVETDAGEGLRWLRRSAEQGDEHSLRLLADVYRNGAYGVSADAAEARVWDERYRNTELYRLRKRKWGAEGA